MDRYLRLPNGKKIKYYNFAITNALIVKFIDADIKELKSFFGTDIIDYIDIVDETDNILENHNLYMKRTSILTESSFIVEYEDRVVKEAWTDEDGVEHPAETEKISKEVPCDITTVILEKPSVSEELDNVKSIVGIVNPNNMTLDEFKDYYKNWNWSTSDHNSGAFQAVYGKTYVAGVSRMSDTSVKLYANTKTVAGLFVR